MRHPLLILALPLAGLIFLTPHMASAQAVGVFGDGLDTIVTSFTQTVSGVGTKLATYARSIMFVMLMIEMVVTFGPMLLTDLDLGQILQALLFRILIVGLFVWLTNVIPAAGGLGSFVQSFAGSMFNATTGQASAPVTPSTLFTYAWQAGSNVYQQSSGITGAAAGAIIFVLCGLIGAVLAAELIVTIVEIHIVFAGAIVALGFAPWSQTRNLARNVLFAAIGSGFKLFGMLLVGTVAVKLLAGFASPPAGTGAIKFGVLILGEILVLALCALKVPAALEQAVMSGGIAASGGGFIASAAGSAVGTMAGLAGMGAAKLGGKAVSAIYGKLTASKNNAAAEAFNATINGGANKSGGGSA